MKLDLKWVEYIQTADYNGVSTKILHTWIFKIAQIFSIVFNFGICYIRWLFERIDQTPGFWTLSFVVRFFGLILFTLLNDIKIFSCSQDFIHICMKKSWNLIRFNTVTTFPVIIWKKVINGILLPKLFWPTVRKNCSCDQENFWNSRLRAKNLQKIWDD